MTLLEKYQHLGQALGWTMLHSLWQIGLIYGIYYLLHALWVKQNTVRYYTCVLAMAACLIWAGLTFYQQYSVVPVSQVNRTGDSHLENALSITAVIQPAVSATSVTTWHVLTSWLEDHTAWLGWLWCAGVLFFSVRLAGGYWLSQRLRQRSRSINDQNVLQKFQLLKQGLNIRFGVQLLESQHIQSPLTLGFWKPAVLLPVGLMLQLSPAQVEVLLLHELAHVRRYDYLINIFQLSLEVCFFYHPLFRLLSREASQRREYACDDLVLHFNNNPWLYANTLTEIKLLSFHPQPPFIMSAIGNSSFSVRIQRIMGFHPTSKERSLPLFLFLLIAAGLIATCWPVRSQASGKQETAAVFTAIQPTAVLPDTVAPGARISRTQPAAKANPAPLPVPEVAVEMSNRHVLYIGLENPLRIAATGVPSNEILVKLVGPGKLQGQGVDYTVQVTTPGEVSIVIYRRHKSQETLLQTLTYQAKSISDPTPLFGGFHSGNIGIAAFISHPLLSMEFDKVDFEVPYEIVGFEMTLLPKEQDPVTYAYHSPGFSENALVAIKSIQVGTKVFIDDIMVKCPGDLQPRNVGGMMLKIVE